MGAKKPDKKNEAKIVEPVTPFEVTGVIEPVMTAPIFRIIPVDGAPNLFRSSRPGYPRVYVPPRELKEALLGFKEDKITNILCLLTDGEYYKYYGKDLVGFYRGHGYKVHRFPIPDFGVPRPEFAYKMVREMDDALRAGKRLLVHCSAGQGRTGLAINCYREWRIFRDKVKFPKLVSETLSQQGFLVQFRYHMKRIHIKRRRAN